MGASFGEDVYAVSLDEALFVLLPFSGEPRMPRGSVFSNRG